MPFPSESFLSMFPSSLQVVVDELRAYASQLTGWLSKEHKADGSHAAVTADSVTLTGDLTVGGDATITGALSADGGEISLDTLNETTVTDGSTGPGIRLGALAALYSRDDGADKYVKLSMDGLTPLQVRKTAGNYFIQPAPLSNAGREINLGSPLESSLRGWFYNLYAFQHYAQGRTVAEGEWTDVPYSAGNFTASAGTWGVDNADQVSYAYTLVGKTMTLTWHIKQSDVSNAASLRIAIPDGHLAMRQASGACRALNNGGAIVAAACEVTAGAAYVTLYADVTGSNFSVTSSDNTFVFGTFSFEVQ